MALTVIDSEDITIDATAGGVKLTEAKRKADKVVRARCTVETAQVRSQVDPAVTLLAGSIGEIWNIGDKFIITGKNDLENFRAIRTGSTSGKLVVSYEGLG